jgi:hypothetical protein
MFFSLDHITNCDGSETEQNGMSECYLLCNRHDLHKSSHNFEEIFGNTFIYTEVYLE